jgi:hypothetical protein
MWMFSMNVHIRTWHLQWRNIENLIRAKLQTWDSRFRSYSKSCMEVHLNAGSSWELIQTADLSISDQIIKLCDYIDVVGVQTFQTPYKLCRCQCMVFASPIHGLNGQNLSCQVQDKCFVFWSCMSYHILRSFEFVTSQKKGHITISSLLSFTCCQCPNSFYLDFATDPAKFIGVFFNLLL